MFNKKNSKENGDNNDIVAIATALQQRFSVSSDIAAIAAAIQQYFGAEHDVESNILTIQRVRPAFETQWNAKYLGFNKLHR
jgi:hypothetical protein